jgi:hypothetical protein
MNILFDLNCAGARDHPKYGIVTEQCAERVIICLKNSIIAEITVLN